MKYVTIKNDIKYETFVNRSLVITILFLVYGRWQKDNAIQPIFYLILVKQTYVWSKPWYLLHLISIRFMLQLILQFTDLMMHWLRSNLIVKVLPWWDFVTNISVSQYKYCLFFSANYLIRRINVRNLNHTKSVIGPEIGLLR